MIHQFHVIVAYSITFIVLGALFLSSYRQWKRLQKGIRNKS
jgi:heme exporter protein D